MSDHNQATEHATNAARLWSTYGIHSAICAYLADATLASVIRVDHTSFDTAVRYLWGRCPEEASKYEARLRNVTDPVRQPPLPASFESAR